MPSKAIIAGGSMAPRLYGRHFSIRCADCGYEFNVDTKIPKQNSFACPNCGFADNRGPGFESEPDQVLIEPNSTDRLQRFELVAIKRDDDYNVVKRVVGFPGEKVEIERGDLFVDSKLIRKGIDIQRDIRIPVHDSGFRPNVDLPQRWRPQDKTSGWVSRNNVFEYKPAPARPQKDFDWLTYHHWRGFHHLASRTDDLPIEDSYAFNQAINRSLVATRDLFLEIQLGSPLTGALAIRVARDGDLFEFQFLPNQNAIVAIGPQFGRVELGLSNEMRDVRRIELTTFDCRLRILVNGREAGSWDLPPTAGNTNPEKYSFQIGARGSDIKISRLRIFRDVYYRNLHDSPADGYQLGTGEYFFLGDNVPLSVDSRSWTSTGVHPVEVLGRVTANRPAANSR